jgi:uncharacterized protein (TIGR02246 family)
MRTRLLCLLALLAMGFCIAARPGLAGQDADKAKDEAAIGKQAEAFIDAFQRGDAKTLAAFWAPDGDYTDETGHNVKGREALQKIFEEFFAENKDLKLRIESKSLRFVTPDVAIEDGTTFVMTPDGSPPSRARFTIVHVKKDGQWLFSSVRDAPFSAPNNYRQLRGLEWALGDWTSENEKGMGGRLSLAWTDNQNFITGTFTQTVNNISVGSATHWIGWDPVDKRVRSWIFDAAGGFGEGAWTRDGNKWLIKLENVRRDGTKSSGTAVVTHIDAETIALQLKDRTVAGKPMDDTPEVKLKRVK